MDDSLGHAEPASEVLTRAQALATRETARDQRELAARPEYTPADPTSAWDPRLAFELAIEPERASEIFERYHVSDVDAARLIGSHAFLQKIKEYQDEVQKTGVSFRLKARLQAEDLLSTSYMLAQDAETPPAVRADIIKWTAKMGGLEPEAKDKGAGGGAPFVLNISYSGGGEPTRLQIAGSAQSEGDQA